LIKRAAPASCLALLLCLVSPAFSRDNYPRRTSLDAVHYRIRLDIPETGEEIRAETEILFALNADGVREIPLDFAPFNVERVTVDGSAAQYQLSEGRLTVKLPAGRRGGERALVSVKYSGRPSDGLFIKQNKFGDRAVFADNWPNRAHHWFPSIDHPYDKATVEFYVKAPARFDVVANGALVETASGQDGTKLTHWREGVPIPVYNMVIGATEFSILNAGAWDGTPLLYYLFPRDRDNGVRDFGRAAQMLEFYTRLVGPYPYEKLALVQSSTRFGGMENSSNIFFDEKSIKGAGQLEGTVAHEIAHQWFGDSVTEADWHHLWLSEGFATYFGSLFFERADGRDKFVERMLVSKERYLKDAGAGVRPIYDPSITDLFKLLNRLNYDKGAWVLHMLRRQMGDEKFFAGVRDYYRTYRDRTALTEDFRHVMELHAGESLDWFFKQWIYEPGHPAFDATWRWDEGAKQLRLRVRQTQSGTVFRAPLDLEIKTGGSATRREVVQIDGRDETFNFKLDARPQGLRLDPDEWVLKVLTLREE